MNVMIILIEANRLTFEEVVKSKKWRDVMNVEIETLECNKTWVLTILPKGVKSIRVKWIFKTKLNESGNIDRYKAKFVAKEYV